MFEKNIIEYFQENRAGNHHSVARYLRIKELDALSTINFLFRNQILEIGLPPLKAHVPKEDGIPYRLRPGYKRRPVYQKYL